MCVFRVNAHQKIATSEESLNKWVSVMIIHGVTTSACVLSHPRLGSRAPIDIAMVAGVQAIH